MSGFPFLGSEQRFTVYTHSIHSRTDTGGFHALAVVNNAARHPGMQVALPDTDFIIGNLPVCTQKGDGLIMG